MRYSVQRALSWEWLDYELPLVTQDGAEWGRSGYGVMRAQIPSPVAVKDGPDGHPMFEEWSTLIHLEVDDWPQRRAWTGVVAEATLDARGWDLKIVEWVGYLDGYPYEGLIRGVKDDPADLMRQLVLDTQSWSNSWLGMSVVGSTPERVGTDLDDRVAAARATMDARKKTLDSFSKTKSAKTKEMQDLDTTLSDEVTEARTLLSQAQKQVNALIQAGAPSEQIEAARQTVIVRQGTYNDALAAYNRELAAGRAALKAAKGNKEAAQKEYDSARDAYDKLKERQSEEGGAFEFRGEDLTDSFKILQEIAAEGNLEWTTKSVYSDGAPDLRIEVHYPRVGRRRDDLVFDTGVNIISELELETPGDYANAAVGVGAGEGPKAIRRSMSVPSHRLRRPTPVEDKTLRTNSQMDAAMRKELALRSGIPFVTSIEVRDHPNCPIGAWSVGDTIRVEGTLRSGQEYSALLRIKSWRWKSRYRASLELEPAI